MRHIRGLQSTPEPSPSSTQPNSRQDMFYGHERTSHLSGPFVIYLFACLDDAQRTTCFFPMAKSTQTTGQQQVINNHRGGAPSALSHRRTISLNHVDAQNVYQHSDDEDASMDQSSMSSTGVYAYASRSWHRKHNFPVPLAMNEAELQRQQMQIPRLQNARSRASSPNSLRSRGVLSPPVRLLTDSPKAMERATFGTPTLLTDSSRGPPSPQVLQTASASQHSHTHTAAQDTLGPDVPALLPENKESESPFKKTEQSSVEQEFGVKPDTSTFKSYSVGAAKKNIEPTNSTTNNGSNVSQPCELDTVERTERYTSFTLVETPTRQTTRDMPIEDNEIRRREQLIEELAELELMEKEFELRHRKRELQQRTRDFERDRLQFLTSHPDPNSAPEPKGPRNSRQASLKALDQYILKPTGIYGGKEEIVRFLSSISVVDDALAAKLLFQGNGSPARATLRSGLYIVRSSSSSRSEEQVFVIYWPEETTWDDTAASSVDRYECRYLTKMCDQDVALISPEHAESIVWNEHNSDDELSESDQDESDRMFSFEVAKTNEQEESVSVRKGFKCTTELLDIPERHPECKLDAEYFKPRLLQGETTQGMLTVKYRPMRRIAELYSFQKFNELQLETLLKNDSLVISEGLPHEALESSSECKASS
ncbi:hypothetical protein BU15DRAFT_69493, partial [Melanogaster broomeanus]